MRQLSNLPVTLKGGRSDGQLKALGYCVIPGFLSADEVASLLAYYAQSGLNAERTQPNYLYAHPDKSREVSRAISEQVSKAMQRHFSSGHLLGGVFMVKRPGQNREMDYHQDWSLVDETEHVSYNLWCPLTDADARSGALSVIERSYLVGLPYRSSTMPPLEIPHSKELKRFITGFSFRAGDAVLYRHSMFHGSGSNLSDTDRIAIACGIIPEGVPFIYQHWNEGRKAIESCEVDQNFYIDHIHDVLSGTIPAKYACVKVTPMAARPAIDRQDFLKALRKVHGIKRFLFFDI